MYQYHFPGHVQDRVKNTTLKPYHVIEFPRSHTLRLPGQTQTLEQRQEHGLVTPKHPPSIPCTIAGISWGETSYCLPAMSYAGNGLN